MAGGQAAIVQAADAARRHAQSPCTLLDPARTVSHVRCQQRAACNTELAGSCNSESAWSAGASKAVWQTDQGRRPGVVSDGPLPSHVPGRLRRSKDERLKTTRRDPPPIASAWGPQSRNCLLSLVERWCSMSGSTSGSTLELAQLLAESYVLPGWRQPWSFFGSRGRREGAWLAGADHMPDRQSVCLLQRGSLAPPALLGTIKCRMRYGRTKPEIFREPHSLACAVAKTAAASAARLRSGVPNLLRSMTSIHHASSRHYLLLQKRPSVWPQCGQNDGSQDPACCLFMTQRLNRACWPVPHRHRTLPGSLWTSPAHICHDGEGIPGLRVGGPHA